MITIDENFDSRESPESDSLSTELLYVIQGTNDDRVVKTLLFATSPSIYNGLQRDSFSGKRQGNGGWDCSVQYPKFSSDSQYTFDTGGGTQRVSQSLQAVGANAASG